jgi:hypothetical protein
MVKRSCSTPSHIHVFAHIFVTAAGGVRSIHHAKTNYEVGSPVALSSSPPGTTSLLAGSTTITSSNPPGVGHSSTSYTVGGVPCSPEGGVPLHRGVSDPGVIAGALAGTAVATGSTSRPPAAGRSVLLSGAGDRAGSAAGNGVAGMAGGSDSVSSLTTLPVGGAAAAAAAPGGADPQVLQQQQGEVGEQAMQQEVAGAMTGTEAQEVGQLKQLLSQRESELASLRQQLARLAHGH